MEAPHDSASGHSPVAASAGTIGPHRDGEREKEREGDKKKGEPVTWQQDEE